MNPDKQVRERKDTRLGDQRNAIKELLGKFEIGDFKLFQKADFNENSLVKLQSSFRTFVNQHFKGKSFTCERHAYPSGIKVKRVA